MIAEMFPNSSRHLRGRPQARFHLHPLVLLWSKERPEALVCAFEQLLRGHDCLVAVHRVTQKSKDMDRPNGKVAAAAAAAAAYYWKSLILLLILILLSLMLQDLECLDRVPCCC